MPKKISIAGAGLGGLAAACCLLKAGYDVELFEQATELGEIGAGIQLSANAMHVLNDLSLGEAIARLSVRPGAYVSRLHDTGEVLSQFPLAEDHEAMHGAPYHQLHRGDLHNLLVAKVRSLKPDAIRLSSQVIGFEESEDHVDLKLSDGSCERADILIGADGVKSAIRAQIFGASPA